MASKRFWSDEILDGCRLAELNMEDVKKVEQCLAVKLPGAYLNLLKEQNGGCLLPNKVANVDLVNKGDIYCEEDFIELSWILGVSRKKEEGILTILQIREYMEVHDRLILLDGSGEYGIFLDYRKHNGNNPPVTYLNRFANVDFVIAADFKEFINKIELRPNVIIVEEWEWKTEGYTFTPEEVEQALLERKKKIRKGNKKFNVAYGLEYLAKQKYDINWFLDQMIQLIGYKDSLFVAEGILAFSRRIKLLNPNEVDLEKMNQVLDTLVDSPHEIGESIKKIKNAVESLVRIRQKNKEVWQYHMEH